MTISTIPDIIRPVQMYHQVPSRFPSGSELMYQYQTPAQTHVSEPTVMYVRAERAAGLAESGMALPPCVV
jgi:hypothetical protein